jgi:hypothetical protein
VKFGIIFAILQPCWMIEQFEGCMLYGFAHFSFFLHPVYNVEEILSKVT